VSGRYSPASSVVSVGPDIPTGPESPWMSDFYDSEMENDVSSHHPRRYDMASSSRDTTLERPSPTTSRPPPPALSATNYMPYRSRNILDRGPYHWPTSAPSTLERPVGTDAGRRRTDLYQIARGRRRAAGDTSADRLDDWINGLLSGADSTLLTSTGGSLRAQSASPLRTTTQQRHVVSAKFPRSVLLQSSSLTLGVVRKDVNTDGRGYVKSGLMWTWEERGI